MGWSSFDDYMNSRTVEGKVLFANGIKVGTAAEAAGSMHSLWRVGNVPAAGADPATSGGGTVYDNTDGSLIKWADLDPLTKHIILVSIRATTSCVPILGDRLVGFGGVSLTSASTSVINMSAPTRYTNGLGVEAYFEVTTQTATPAPQVRLQSYTNQDGTPGRQGALITFPAAATNVDTLVGPLPLQEGDIGIRSVESVNVGVAGSAGVANVILLHPLLEVPLATALGNVYEGMATLEQVYDGATLMLYYQAGTTTATTFRYIIKAGY